MENSINQNELIVVKQLPVIEEQLMKVKEQAEARTDLALSMLCTEDTVKDVKKVRSDLNKEFSELEARRKEVKSAIMAPYERFESVYKECVSDIYKKADGELKGKIDNVESELKREKENEIRQYFEEYRESLALDTEVARFEWAGIKVGLSDSRKSLKDKAKAYLDGVFADIKLINIQEYVAETMHEYLICHDVSKAILIVAERHKRMAEEEARLAKIKEAEMERQAAEAEVMAIAAEEAPKVVEEVQEVTPEKLYSVTFMVNGTLAQLKALKEFLNNGGYDYE